MVSLRYNGTGKRKVAWCSNGVQYSFVVNPGDVIRVPESEANRAMGNATFERLDYIKITAVKNTTSTKPNVVQSEDEVISEVIETKGSVETNEVIEKKEKPDPLKVIVKTEEKMGVDEKEVEELKDSDEAPEDFDAFDKDYGIGGEAVSEAVSENMEDDCCEEGECSDKEDSPGIDYTSFLKRDLVRMCKERELQHYGNRDDLIARLVNDDIAKNNR